MKLVCYTVIPRARLHAKITTSKNKNIRTKGYDLAVLLSHPDAIPFTLQFITDTGRFPRHVANPTHVYPED